MSTRKSFDLKAIIRQVTRRGHDRTEAEDFVQSAYVRMLERKQSIEIENERAYVTRAAINIALNGRRQRTAHISIEGYGGDWVAGEEGDPLQDEVLIARQRLSRVSDGLAHLPERTRAIFLRHRLDGRKYREIAEEFGISVSAVEKHIAKAMMFITKWASDW